MTEAEKKALAEQRVAQTVDMVSMVNIADRVWQADKETSADKAILWGTAIGVAVTLYHGMTHDVNASAAVGGVLVLVESFRHVPARLFINAGVKKIDVIAKNMLAREQVIVNLEDRPRPEVVLAEEALRQTRLEIAARQKFDQEAAAAAQKREERLAEIERGLDKSIGFHARHNDGVWTSDDNLTVTGTFIPEWKDLLRRVKGLTEPEALVYVRTRYGQLLAAGQNSQYKYMVDMLKDTIGMLDQQIEVTRPKPTAIN